MNICICGGGNLGHALAGEISKNEFITSVNVLTRNPQKWQNEIEVFHNKDFSHTNKIDKITDDKSMLKDMDIVIITIPAQFRYQYLQEIKKYIKENAILVSAPSIGGINYIFEKLFPQNPYVCLQRVPYVCRIKEYGKSVSTDKKTEIDGYFSKISDSKIIDLISKIFNLKINKLETPYTLFLSNSNPILHIAGVCELIKKDYPRKNNPFFYDVWNDSTSEFTLNMDSELEAIMQKLNVNEFKNLYKHYEINNVQELTNKLKSIPSFKEIKSPLVLEKENYIIDSNSRYIVEDLPYGTCVIKYFGLLLGLKTPNIDLAISKVQKFLGYELIDKNGNFNMENWEKILGFSFKNLQER